VNIESEICYLLFVICYHRVAVQLFAICHRHEVAQDGQVIRSAVPSDASEAISLILDAIGSIAFILTGTTDRQEAGFILDQFFRQKGNRVSYENALVLEDSSEQRSREVVGVALIYDGSIARTLDEPLEQAAIQKSGLSDYRIPTEAEPSEFYLDTISVDPKCQGRGFGRDLIEASCEQARKFGRDRIGLLVDIDNSGAKRLYERLGFRTQGRKEIAGFEYFHMTRIL
jgi:ribosomal protein S18 acetylase RimI-like enzyme